MFLPSISVSFIVHKTGWTLCAEKPDIYALPVQVHVTKLTTGVTALFKVIQIKAEANSH